MGLCCSTDDRSSMDQQPVPPSPFEAHAQHTPAVPPNETFQNPMILDDDATVSFSTQIRQMFSQASEPVLADPGSAVVNMSVFGRDRGRSITAGGFQRLDSLLPKQGAQFLSWTHSRKLLEAAIAAEQQSIPEEAPVERRPSSEWELVAAREERLRARLGKFQLDMWVMEGDGNCQFRSVSFGLYGTQEYHGYVRQKALEHMRARAQDYQAFLGEDVGTYLHEMSKDGVWGDELTLRAICDTFGCVVNIITSDADNWFLRYLPQHKAALRHEIFLTYIAPIHYNAIRRHPGSNNSLGRGGSFERKHSQILRAVDAYCQRQVLPDNPERLTELVGQV